MTSTKQNFVQQSGLGFTPETPGRCFCNAKEFSRHFIAGEIARFRKADPDASVLSLDAKGQAGQEMAPWNRLRGYAQWDLIVSAEFVGDLPDVAAKHFIAKTVSMLKPGGRLIVSSVYREASAGECPQCLLPGRNYRTEFDMANLPGHVKDSQISGQAVFTDDSELNLYLELYKRCR